MKVTDIKTIIDPNTLIPTAIVTVELNIGQLAHMKDMYGEDFYREFGREFYESGKAFRENQLK